MSRLLLCIALFSAGVAAAYEGAKREELDAGVHVPQLTRPPELLSFVEAPYPPEAERLGKSGSVRMAVTIDADGSVSEVQVLEPIGDGFDDAAVEAVKQFRFSPAEVDHVPAPVAIEYVYNFALRLALEDAGAIIEPPPIATLTGQLLARGSRNRVPGATVRCGDEADAEEATSDEEGRFTLTVAAGDCLVRVVASGFERFQTTETLAPGERTEVIYHLMPQAVGYETVVRGAREKKEVVRRTLQRQELQKIPGTFGDPVRVIQNLPGVARAPFISGQLIVRGAAPDQTKTLLDGVEIPLLYHLGGGPSVVNAEFLDRIDFYPGGFGTRYGRAIGGVVDVATRKGARDTVHGSLKIDLLDTGFFVEAPVGGNISVAAAARRSYVDALIPLVLPEDPEGGSLLVLPRYWDYQVRADFGARPTAEALVVGASTYYVMAFGSDDVLKIVATGGGRNRDVSLDVQTVFHRVKGDWTFRQGPFTSVFSPYAGYDLAHVAFGDLSLDANNYSTGVREDAALELSKHLTLRAGMDIQFSHLAGEGDGPPLGLFAYVPFPGAEPEVEPERIARTANTFDGALYAELDLKLGPVTVTPGLRATHARVTGQDRQVLDPRLFLRYQLFEGTQLKGSAGLFSQAPDAFDLLPPLGNPNLTFERAFQTSAGVEQRVTSDITLDVTGFFNRRYQLVTAPGNIIQNEDGSITRERSGNVGLGRAYGVEVLLRHEVTREFFGWLAYTLNRSEFRRSRSEGFSATDYNITDFDQTHILTLVGSYRLPLGFEIGGRFRYVTGRPTTPLVRAGDRYNVDSNGFSPRFGDRFSTRLRDFHQLDLRLDKNFVFTHWTLNAYVDVQNVYNQENVEATFSDYRFRETVEVPGIPILPVIGVKGSF